MTATKIEWCNHTFNPWTGCTKVSPACKNCYAARDVDRRGGDFHGQRVFRAESYWQQPAKWDRAAAKAGKPALVFVASQADIFEIHPDPGVAEKQASARRRLAGVIEETPNLRWLLLTKRPENFGRLADQLTWVIPEEDAKPRWVEPTGRVWVGVTAENQEYADKRIPELLKIPCALRFVSCEPLLGPLGVASYLSRDGLLAPFMTDCFPGLSWVIAGGESGPKARPSHPDWFRSLRDQCAAAGVPFHFKQWGEWAPNCLCFPKPHRTTKRPGSGLPGVMFHCGKRFAGRLLDGVEHDGRPL